MRPTRTRTLRAVRLAALAVALAVLTPASPASATPSGGNGRIAFAVDGDIWTIGPRGGDPRRLAGTTTPASDPSWSPDGSAIAFSSEGGVYVMNAGGNDVRLLAPDARDPAWSPDGSSIAVTRNQGIVLYSPFGFEQRYITVGEQPAWSPDGRRLAFTRAGECCPPHRELRTINVDGSLDRRVGDFTFPGYRSLSWSPGGSHIAYILSGYRSSSSRAEVVATAGGAPQGLGEANDIVWAPDGTVVARSVARYGPRPEHPAPGLYTTDGAGGGASRILGFEQETSGMDWQRIDPGVLVESQALRFDQDVYEPGESIAARVQWRNAGPASLRIRQAVITIRRPGATNLSGPFDDFSPRVGAQDVAPGALLGHAASFRVPDNAPLGQWFGFATWQDFDGRWHDGPSLQFRVQRRPPVSNPPPVKPPDPAQPDQPGPTTQPSRSEIPVVPGTGAAPPVVVTVTGSGPTVTGPVASRQGPPEAAVLVRSRSLRTLRRRGVAVTVLCSERCLVDLRLTTSSGRTLARGTGAGRAARRATVRLRPTAVGRRVLRSPRTVRLVLRGSVADASDNRRQVRSVVVFR